MFGWKKNFYGITMFTNNLHCKPFPQELATLLGWDHSKFKINIVAS